MSKSLDCSEHVVSAFPIWSLVNRAFIENREMLLAVQVCYEAIEMKGLAYGWLKRMEEDG